MESFREYVTRARQQVSRQDVEWRMSQDVIDTRCPRDISLHVLQEQLSLNAPKSHNENLDTLAVAEALLRGPYISHQGPDNEAILCLYAFFTPFLHPPQIVLPQSEYSIEAVPSAAEVTQALSTYHHTAYLILHSFTSLTHLPSCPSHLLPVPTLSSLILPLTFLTFPERSFCTPTISKLATALLKDLHPLILANPTIITHDILHLTIRPLFQTSAPNPSVTPMGRLRNPSASSSRYQPSTFDASSPQPTWQTSSFHLLQSFRYILTSLPTYHPAILLPSIWHLLVPPPLTLLASHHHSHKLLGLITLHTLIKQTPPSLLIRTGLGGVFFDTLSPLTIALPSLTPREESLDLLPGTYDALIELIRRRFPDDNSASPPHETTSKLTTTQSSTISNKPTVNRPRMAALDRLLRDSILAGIVHCPEETGVVTILIRAMGLVVREMRGWSVRHLRITTSTLSTILSSPLLLSLHDIIRSHNDSQHVTSHTTRSHNHHATKLPPENTGKTIQSPDSMAATKNNPALTLLQTCLTTLETVIQNGWMRIWIYRGEIVRAIVGIWIRLDPSSEADSDRTRFGAKYSPDDKKASLKPVDDHTPKDTESPHPDDPCNQAIQYWDMNRIEEIQHRVGRILRLLRACCDAHDRRAGQEEGDTDAGPRDTTDGRALNGDDADGLSWKEEDVHEHERELGRKEEGADNDGRIRFVEEFEEVVSAVGRESGARLRDMASRPL